MRWLKMQADALVGIDIGTRYIKLVELNFTNAQPTIVNFAIAELPMEVLTERHEIKNSATISSTISQLQLNTKITTKKVSIAVPGGAVVTKQIILNGELTDSEMEAQAWLEASKQFPDLIEDLSLDFYVMGNSSTPNNNQQDVMLVACRKTTLQKIMDVLEACHLEVEIVDVDYYALERILKYMVTQLSLPPDKIYAILNFGSYASSLVVIQNQQLLYAYDHLFEGQYALQHLQQEMQWEDILLHPKLTEEVNVDALQQSTAFDPFIAHANYALELFYSSKNNAPIEKLFLAGDCAVIPHFATVIAQKIGISVVTATPIVNMAHSVNIPIENLQAVQPALALACGLALHEGR